MREYDQNDGEGEPVRAKPRVKRRKLALPVHVGERYRQAARVLVEVVLQPDAVHDGSRNYEQQHEHPAHELVGHQHLQEHSEYGHEQAENREGQDVPLEVVQ